MRTMIRRLGWGVLAVILVACGGGSGDLPPVRPSSVVYGNAVDAEIQNGQVTMYAFGRSGKGERLGGGVTDARGFYSLELRAPSQPVLIEVSGGRYTEEASGVAVDVGEGQVLRAVAHYVSGQPLSLMVTPLTQLAAGLTRSDLRDDARSRATSAHAVLGGKVPAATSAFGPVIVPKLAPGAAFNGVYNFEVVIGSVLGAETVRFDVNGTAVGDAVAPAHPAVAIDTRGYADGEYTIGVAAADFLGFGSFQQFKYRFDNIFVNVTSATATNQTPFVLTGNYGDNGYGLMSLTVQGQAITPNPNKTWSAQVQLTLGRNHVPVVIATQSGPTEQSDVIVDYDVGVPLIDTGVGHGNACFANGGACTALALADRNDGAPVVIATDHADLAGVAVTRVALGSNI